MRCLHRTQEVNGAEESQENRSTQMCSVETDETTSWLRVFADLSEDLDLNPSTYVG